MKPSMVNLGFVILIEICPPLTLFLTSSFYSLRVFGRIPAPVILFSGRNLSFCFGNFGTRTPFVPSSAAISAELYTCWYFAFYLPEMALILCVRNCYVGSIGFVLPLP